MKLSTCCVAALVSFCVAAVVHAEPPAVKYEAMLLMVDSNEGIAAGDLDGDGKTDLVAGRNWFRNGDWAPRPLRTIEDWNGYVQSNGDYLWDMNGDGRLDVIAGSFVPSEVHWYENPGDEGLRLGKMWTQHLLVDTKYSQNEGQLLEDIDGDGRPEWIVNSWNKKNPTVVWRLVDKKPAAKKTDNKPKGKNAKAADGGAIYELQPSILGEKVNGHGMAVGDLNGDGLKDVLVGLGWYEQPKSDPWGQPWKFHAAWDLHASVPMIVVDLDKDNDSDLIFGNGHDYGLIWWENTGTKDGEIEFKEHKIDDSYSQPHTLHWVDLDGDGESELISGKRYYAHNGKDPGGMEMPCLYYYKWNNKTKKFARHTIEEGHVGCGLQIVAENLAGDEKVDIAVAGKSGTYLLLAK